MGRMIGACLERVETTASNAQGARGAGSGRSEYHRNFE